MPKSFLRFPRKVVLNPELFFLFQDFRFLFVLFLNFKFLWLKFRNFFFFLLIIDSHFGLRTIFLSFALLNRISDSFWFCAHFFFPLNEFLFFFRKLQRNYFLVCVHNCVHITVFRCKCPECIGYCIISPCVSGNQTWISAIASL